VIARILLRAAPALLVLSGCATTEVAKSPNAPAAPTAPAASPSPPSPAPPPAASTTARPGAPSAAPAAPPSTASPATSPVQTTPRSIPPTPAGPLRPEVPAAEEQRLLESTRQSIGDITRIVGELEGRPMKPPQQESLRTAKNFLDQARAALDQRDYQRAANLASKARALTDDLAGATK
jgi:hypothetical protein